jgi:hypothetical protein
VAIQSSSSSDRVCITETLTVSPSPEDSITTGSSTKDSSPAVDLISTSQIFVGGPEGLAEGVPVVTASDPLPVSTKVGEPEGLAEGVPVVTASDPLPVSTKVGEPVDSSEVGLDVVVADADGLPVDPVVGDGVSSPAVGLDVVVAAEEGAKVLSSTSCVQEKQYSMWLIAFQFSGDSV